MDLMSLSQGSDEGILQPWTGEATTEVVQLARQALRLFWEWTAATGNIELLLEDVRKDSETLESIIPCISRGGVLMKSCGTVTSFCQTSGS